MFPSFLAACLAGHRYAAAQDHAFAPDRYGTGTNGAATVSRRRFTFAFGDGSLARHLDQTPDAQLGRRPGLGLDTPDDLNATIAARYAPMASGRPGRLTRRQLSGGNILFTRYERVGFERCKSALDFAARFAA